MKGQTSIGFRFLYDSYEVYYREGDPALLAHQLARGATLLALAYIKARRAVMDAHGFDRYTAVDPPISPRHREYLERGAELIADGESADGRIRVRTRAMQDFKVRLAPETFRTFNQTHFLVAANSAVVDLKTNYTQVLRELRHELRARY